MDRYTSPSRLRAEARALFRGALPIVVGREEALPGPGAFFTHDASPLPLLVTRDAWGTVHVLVNECRHRGTRLVLEERGDAPRFVCAHHGWTYDTCGRLTTVALSRCDADRARKRDPDDSGLVMLPSETRHGFVWIARDFPHAAIDAALGGAALAERRTLTTATSDVAASWKIVVEELLSVAGATFVFPGTFVVTEGEGAEHVAVVPREADRATIVRTTLAKRSVVGALASSPAVERAIAAAIDRDVLVRAGHDVPRRQTSDAEVAFHAEVDRRSGGAPT